ncbi:hypothetical protein [Runella slithyformis]|uniref:Cytochrome C Planctomycete-type domain-containing protein n=1 Tax=Runella slithyformis (strain ATCC 29530 / DSM 19594 / LMG 11500 / NCIMB 11436 / LSU 4) TaxID=761193 RepID=A0A7U3ZM63_RUNSL|nr:hypothetical protein [Runella slithyformis]AEI49786.1 hypothetical protein Runsl_3420 [Runella slithyformis DSM 19594]
MKISSLLFNFLLLGMVTITVNACKTKEEVIKTTERASFDLIQQRIFTPTCATAGCHASEQAATFGQHGLVLAAGKSYDYLINKDPKNQNAAEDKQKRVLPFFSLQSLLFHKLTWDAGAHHGGKVYGAPMPLNGTALYKGQIEFIRRWIEAGAPRTGAVADTTLLDDKTPSF